MQDAPNLGIIIVCFNSSGVISDCLESVLESYGVNLDILLVDNASTDNTVAFLEEWIADRVQRENCFHRSPSEHGAAPANTTLDVRLCGIGGFIHRIRLIASGANGGFAAGVNIGLSVLLTNIALNRFWILNPDCAVDKGSALAFATQGAPDEGFSLMGGRVIYQDESNRIQIDGGTINWSTGVTGNIHQGCIHDQTAEPNIVDIAFISGASMVASREFVESVGLLPEDYFLYYEEVDWALRRGRLPFIYCRNAIVYHKAGTAIGSHTLDRPATSFSLYFKHRSRIKFMRKFFVFGLPGAFLYSFAKAMQLALKGYLGESWAIVAGSLGFSPPRSVLVRLSPETRRIVFRR